VEKQVVRILIVRACWARPNAKQSYRSLPLIYSDVRWLARPSKSAGAKVLTDFKQAWARSYFAQLRV